MAPEPSHPSFRRITLVADELLGYVRTGGLGTQTTFLALALARMGHRVEILYVGEPPATAIDPEWARPYERAGISIRHLARSGERVEPEFFARVRDVDRALRGNPPDVVITQDLASPAYTARRLRHLGLDFEGTLFVVFCHGTRRWITDVSRKVRVLPGALAVTVLERASLELADVVVSPSAYMIEWMRGQGWHLPERTLVIPSLTRSGATGEAPEQARIHDGGGVKRLAFFGRLEERKGVRPFLAGVNALGPEQLEGLELEFIGRSTKAWTPERVEALFSETARQSLRRISFETDLDQHEALARLSRPGTLAVMPSLEDNSPMTVYECLERGIPFIASHVGGTGELVAPDDRARVLFEPTPDGIEAALRRALSGGDALRPARPAFQASASLEAWAEVIATRPSARARAAERPAVDVVVVHRRSKEALSRCLSALERQSYTSFGVIVAAAGHRLSDIGTPEGPERQTHGRSLVLVASEAASVDAARQAGLHAGKSAWIVFLDEEDVPEAELLETLVRAQAASGADVVSCGLYLRGDDGDRVQHYFLGEPGGLGLLANAYGTVALVRRSLLLDVATRWPVEGDPDWPLLAGLSITGARVVSVPAPLVTRRARPGALELHPSDALLVLEQLECALPDPLRSVARLAAGLAAADAASSPTAPSSGVLRRAGGVLREEGPSELARRTLRRLSGGHR